MNAKLLFTLFTLFSPVKITNGGITYNQRCRKALPEDFTSRNTKEISDSNYYDSDPKDAASNDQSSDEDADDSDDDDSLEIILPPAEPHRINFDDQDYQEHTVTGHHNGWHFTQINHHYDVISNGEMQPSPG